MLKHHNGFGFCGGAADVFKSIGMFGSRERCAMRILNYYKAIRRDMIQSIRIEENRFGFEPEITAKVARKNCRIYKVGISYLWAHLFRKTGARHLVQRLVLQTLTPTLPLRGG
ncbi:MAG: hypothetical protein ACKN9T_05550 [Candidatus Methylumidiphilus sp.]